MAFHTKHLWLQNHWVLGSIKTYGFIKIYNGIRYLVLFAFEQYDAITIGLDI